MKLALTAKLSVISADRAAEVVGEVFILVPLIFLNAGIYKCPFDALVSHPGKQQIYCWTLLGAKPVLLLDF